MSRTEKNTDRGKIAAKWWRELQPEWPDGRRNFKGDRAALARLRRAASPADVLHEPRVHELYRMLGYSAREVADRLPWVAAAAMALAHVREHGGTAPPRAVGPRGAADAEAETAAMKPLRFRRLLSAREPEDVAREMRRLVGLADRKLDTGALAAAILDWDRPGAGDRVRTRWAYDYYDAGGAAPEEAAPAGRAPDEASPSSP